MMGRMRENTKIILWVVVASFVVTIFAVWGLDLRTGKSPTTDPNLLGKVNGVPIARGQYQSFYQSLANQFRGSSNEPLTYSQEEFVANQAWDNLVYTILTDQQIKKLRIAVSNEEVVSYLRNTPPPEIQQYFLDDEGKFDNESYQAALNNPEIDWTNLEQLARERIPRLKLQNYLAARVFVTEDEVRLAYMSENTEMKIQYVEFPIDETDVPNYTPSEEEIEGYYNSHHDEFVDPAKARIDVVRFDLKPSAEDLRDTAFTAERVLDQILAGEDFGALAKTYSEAPTSHVDGSTGFIRRGQREEAYFDALDAMKPGDVGKPVAIEGGYYILKLVETKEANGEKEYNTQEILIKSALSRQTVDSLYTVASEFREHAKDVGLDVAAKEKGYTMFASEPFTEGSPVGALGFVPALNRFAFENVVGTLSPLLRDEEHLYVVRVVDRVPEGVRPLADVSESIRHRLVFQARRDATLGDAKEFYRKAVASSMEEAANFYAKTIKEPPPFKAVDNLEGFGPNSAVAQIAIVTDPGRISPPVAWRRSFVVVRAIDRQQVDETDYQTKALRIRETIEARKIQAYAAYWFEKLKEESVIEDYRNRAF